MPKHFVIVGGSSGIGLQIVRQLVADGHAVTVLSRSWNVADEFPDVAHRRFDVLDEELPSELLAAPIDGLAYCPGSINLRSIRAMPIATMRADFELNVLGAVKLIQAALPGLKAATAGGSTASIVLFSTVAVGQGIPMHASVAASKGAVEGLTRSIAADLSPHIRVNCVAPALTQTPLAANFFSSPEKSVALAKMYPLGRTGIATDVAAAACFLLGEQSSWITGQIIGVDGGMSAIKK